MKTPFFILIFSFSTFLCGQNYDTNWKGHFSFLNIKKVVEAENKFYAASENALFSYDTQTNQLNTS